MRNPYPVHRDVSDDKPPLPRGLQRRRGRPRKMQNTVMQPSKEKIAEFCERHHIHRLSLFGSVLCGDFGPRSDISAPLLYGWRKGEMGR